ncbi:MAG: hypothetical protein ACP5D3_05260 [Sulfurovum sp.]
MKRRSFLGLGAVMTGAALFPTTTTASASETIQKPKGAVTLYYEFRVPMPEKRKVLEQISQLDRYLQDKKGFLSFSLKQMTGESTMVKNYPAHLKVLLIEGMPI